MTAITAVNLTKKYDDLVAVDSLNLSVDNEIYGLLGPNGSGKTTTVSMFTTLLRVTSGSASICGHNVMDEPSAVRDCISYVPQDMAVDIRLTGRENVDFFAKLYGIRNKEERKRRVDDAIEVMNLTDRADDITKKYSGGMRRRLELAQALVHNPDVLFLDEPTVGLDVAARRSIWEHIVKLRGIGMTVFVTTHQMDEAERYCDRVGILKKGVLVKEGAPSQLTSEMKHIITIHTDGGFPSETPVGIDPVLNENGIVLFTAENGPAALPKLIAAYDREMIKVFSSSVREPTLEDVYLSFAGHADDCSFNDKQFRNIMRRK